LVFFPANIQGRKRAMPILELKESATGRVFTANTASITEFEPNYIYLKDRQNHRSRFDEGNEPLTRMYFLGDIATLLVTEYEKVQELYIEAEKNGFASVIPKPAPGEPVKPRNMPFPKP
jgi:hypothetical protein